jgi:hypothetical protein
VFASTIFIWASSLIVVNHLEVDVKGSVDSKKDFHPADQLSSSSSKNRKFVFINYIKNKQNLVKLM